MGCLDEMLRLVNKVLTQLDPHCLLSFGIDSPASERERSELSDR